MSPKQRAWRPKNWTNSHGLNPSITTCPKCYEKTTTGKIQIHLHEGMDSHDRRTAQKWLEMTEHHADKLIETDMQSSSHRHRIGVLRWLNENISNNETNENIFKVEFLLRGLLRKRAERKQIPPGNFGNFIKLVHSHKLSTFLDI